MKQFNITTSQSEAILFFKRNDGAIVSDFAKHMLISHQATRNIVERLKEKGLLSIQVDEEDARARKVHLTDKGATLHDDLVKLGIAAGEKILLNFSDLGKIFAVAVVGADKSQPVKNF